MSDYKFLSDGRKVAIVGKLNAKETIVQEIFIANGNEIPSGENFVVKSLHDSPVISYQIKENQRLKEQKERYKRKIDDLTEAYNNIEQKLKARRDILKNVDKFIQLVPEEEMEVFTMFLTGTIEYIVVDSYNITEPQKMIDKIVSWDNYREQRYDELKLISVMGGSDGKLGYKIHRYSDGSGNTDYCYPFANLEDARLHIKYRAIGMIEKNSLSKESYDVCKKMDIKFTENHEAMFKKKYLDILKENIKNIEKNKKKYDKDISKYEEKIRIIEGL